MKILHINSYYSGSNFYKNLYDAQVANELDIDVFVPVSSSYKRSQTDFGLYTNLSFNYKKYDRLFFYLKQSKIYKDLLRQYKISLYSLIHSHSLFSNGYIAMKLKKKYKIPYIVTVRNTDVNIFFKKMFFLRKIGIQILENADHIIYLSEPYRDEVIQKYVPNNLKEFLYKKTSIIPNGIDDFWLENKGNSRNLSNENELKLLYVGVVNKNKNIITTIQAINLLLNKGIKAKLTVVGKIEDKSIYDQIKMLDCVEYIEPQPKEKLLKIYRQNDIFVMPSIHESFGLVYAEAMSQGLPVIYTRGQGFDKQFNEGEIGFSVDCLNANDIAVIIEKIIFDYELLSKNCLVKSDILSWKNIEKNFLTIYEKISSTKIEDGGII